MVEPITQSFTNGVIDHLTNLPKETPLPSASEAVALPTRRRHQFALGDGANWYDHSAFAPRKYSKPALLWRW
jgi:hypothetical protein